VRAARPFFRESNLVHLRVDPPAAALAARGHQRGLTLHLIMAPRHGGDKIIPALAVVSP